MTLAHCLNQSTPDRKFQAIGYLLAPAVPGRAIADVERRILGDCRTYSQAAKLATLWRSSNEDHRALVVLKDKPTLTIPSLAELQR